MTFSTLFRAVREASGLTQAVISARAGLAVPNLSAHENGRREPRFDTAEAAFLAVGYQLVAVGSVRSTAAEIAEVISEDLSAGDLKSAFRALIQISDNLVAEPFANRLALCLTPPASVGDPYWDASIAGVVQYRLDAPAKYLPTWLFDAWRVAPSLAELPSGPRLWGLTSADSPKEFVSRNVLVDARSLESV